MKDPDRLKKTVEDVESSIGGRMEQLEVSKLFQEIMEKRKARGELVISKKKLATEGSRERVWALENLPKFLADSTQPMEKRVRFAICLALRVPDEMMDEIKGVAQFDEWGMFCQVKIGNIDWAGKLDKKKFSIIGKRKQQAHQTGPPTKQQKKADVKVEAKDPEEEDGEDEEAEGEVEEQEEEVEKQKKEGSDGQRRKTW